MRKTKQKDNPYQGLRNQALSMTPEQLGLLIANVHKVYGVVMDWHMGNVIATIAALMTGDASVYLSTGQAFIGGYTHEAIVNAAKVFVTTSENYLSQASRTDTTTPPQAGTVIFYLLTKSGRYSLEAEFKMIENNQSVLRPLFEAGDKIITEYRLISE